MAGPAVSDWSPDDFELDTRTPIAVSASDADLVNLITIYYPGLRFTEVIYDGAAFTERYEGSLVNDQGQPATIRYTFRRLPVWPDTPFVQVYAAKSNGQLVQATQQYILRFTPAGRSEGTSGSIPQFP